MERQFQKPSSRRRRRVRRDGPVRNGRIPRQGPLRHRARRRSWQRGRSPRSRQRSAPGQPGPGGSRAAGMAAARDRPKQSAPIIVDDPNYYRQFLSAPERARRATKNFPKASRHMRPSSRGALYPERGIHRSSLLCASPPHLGIAADLREDGAMNAVAGATRPRCSGNCLTISRTLLDGTATCAP